MPWEKSYRETEVLDRAMRAFWARGFEATSMADLVEATGINRGSIYAAFTDKRGLFLRALDHYDGKHRAEFLDRMARRHDPKQAIIATFESAAHPRKKTPGGCLLVNTALEMSPHDPEIADYVDARLRAVETFFRERIEAAQASGQIRRGIDPGTTAQALLGLFVGLRVLTRSKPRRDAISAITAQARVMLE